MASQKHLLEPVNPASPKPDEALIRRILTRATLQLPPAEPSPADTKTNDETGDPPPGTGPYAADSEQQSAAFLDKHGHRVAQPAQGLAGGLWSGGDHHRRTAAVVATGCLSESLSCPDRPNLAASALRFATHGQDCADSAHGRPPAAEENPAGTAQPITATAHKPAKLVCSTVSYGHNYGDAGAECCEAQHQQRTLRAAKGRAT